MNKTSNPVWDVPYRADGVHESNNAFESFIMYRDMGVKRSLITLSRETSIDYNKILLWSSKYHWNDRIQAMIEYNNRENQKINSEIKEEALDMIKHRLKTKNEIIDKLFGILKNNLDNYDYIDLNFKEFTNLFSLAMKLENININDLSNIADVEQMLKDGGIDAQSIQAFINNYSMVLTQSNKDAIDTYQEDVKDDNF